MEFELCAHRDQIKRRSDKRADEEEKRMNESFLFETHHQRDQIKRRADNRADEEEKRMNERRDRIPHTERYQVETPILNGYLHDPEENHDSNHPYNLFADIPDRYSRMTKLRSSPSPVSSSARSDDETRADREDMSMM